MIPKRIIEKAIEGGWKPDVDEKPLSKNRVEYIKSLSLCWQEIALDPSFWQALEITTRVPCGEHVKRGYCSNCDDKGFHRPLGSGTSLGVEFCVLILTGKNTDKFWEQILPTNH